MSDHIGFADSEAIKVTMARYWRFTDTKDWEGLRGLFADDMTMWAPDDVEGVPPLVGADRVARAIQKVLGSAISSHRGYAPEIEMAGPDEARAIWGMDDSVQYPDDPQRNFSGAGHYHATYVRTSGGWKIRSLTVRRTRLDRA